MGEWDLACLKTVIPQQLRDQINEVTITLSDEPDTIIWNETATGVFTCQSAYHVLRKQESDLSYNHFNWNTIWKSKLTNKLKHFLWLVVQNKLNTNSLRFKRKITENAGCVQCEGEEETVMHIFRHCAMAKKIWKEVINQEELVKFETIPDNTWMNYNLKRKFKNRLNGEVSWLATFAATIWLLWKARNAVIFRGSKMREDQLVFAIKQVSSNLQIKVDPNCDFVRNLKWIKPLPTWKKLNVDGSVRSITNCGAIGCVLRDEKGNWMWSYAAPIRHPSVNETEILSLLHGLQKAWEQRIPKIQVELDSSMVYDWVVGDEDPPRELQDKVKCCKVLIRKPWEIMVKKIDRKTNVCADHLARLGYNCEEEGRTWLAPLISVIPILGMDMDD